MQYAHSFFVEDFYSDVLYWCYFLFMLGTVSTQPERNFRHRLTTVGLLGAQLKAPFKSLGTIFHDV